MEKRSYCAINPIATHMSIYNQPNFLPTTLFCLPFAGGSSYAFREFQRRADSAVRVTPIELPGRGKRYNEPLVTDIHNLADDIFRQIKDDLGTPYAIYGHSMGSLLSYLLSLKIQAHGLPLPNHVFVSGRGGPSVTYEDENVHNLPKHQFIEKLREIGGSSDEILNDEKLMDFFEPIIRADFQAVQSFCYTRQPLLEVGITCMIGTDDKKTSLDQAKAWSRESTQPCDVIEYAGNHFFILDHIDAILEVFRKKLDTRPAVPNVYKP